MPEAFIRAFNCLALDDGADIAGSMPFSASAYPVLRQLHLHQAPPRPSLHAPVDPAFDDIVVRAVSKDPADRYPNVNAFLEDVRAATVRVARTEMAEGGRIRRLAIGLLVEILADLDARLRADAHAP